jgi:hypothetical protein
LPGDPLAVSEEKALQNCIRRLTNQKHTHTCYTKTAFVFDLQQELGELVISITSCPSIITLENTFN